ncbi:MAG: hypothetical protein QGH85_02030 [Candidatus Pacebacteria bacterium]|jgi:hypothetical protein|nr:hypothetical protein [Parcubacteria group bacterium]MDP6249537.1 hypothetical protein [Candidatus Paceibacterota bacterium]MDP7159520.1 hypothetical protein [Candidatus Paceibacterota bacterium]MDP7366392.1 hypothetical protein [Candidatus Paceibacterota bacterium]MDP7466378.1 hypothetical protein [Candidatus Paceibacterota bacterium]|tara:strand:- start:10965 stop:12254 length:1290 start_codon:yes stop_codon:yes gene_type:complete
MSKSHQRKIPTNKGQAMITVVMFLLAGSLIVIGGVSSPVLKDIKITRNLEESKQSFSLSEGAVEDVVYRIQKGLNFSDTEILSVNGVTATTTTVVLTGKREVVAVGDKNNIIRTTRALMAQGDGVSLNYGVQVGDGGIIMENSSSVQGNIYSSGPVTGSGSNITSGTVISAGPNGLIDGIHATSSGYAHTINNSEIDGDAYYQNISNTEVDGTLYPWSTDQPTTTMPILDSLISQWETDAEIGGVISSPCPYKIDSDVTIGPVKITCDVEISGSPIVTLEGHIWITGNLLIKNSSDIKVASSIGSGSVAMIADNPSDRLTSSKAKITNSAEFFGAGLGSYILVVSQNESAENGGSEKAIEVENSANGDLLIYASHGEILLQNSVSLKEVTGYKIRIKNSAEVIYETGIASLLFTSGPSGGFSIDSWLEI